MSLRVGIDFGTSNSGVAVARAGQVRVLPIDRSNLVPEVVKTILYITRDGNAFIGQEAVELYYQHNIGRARRFVKKRVGEVEYRGGDMFYVTDVYAYIDEMAPGRLLQYLKTALRSNGYEGTFIFERFYTPAQLVAIYLRELKRRAEEQLHEEITGVTLGRPVHFSIDPLHDQRAESALRQAAQDAGFKSVDFEFEPVAAALDYARTLTRPETVLVFDFGGGTLDITIMHLDSGAGARREIFASGGVDIAGSDFDRAIIQRRMLPHFGLGIVEGEPVLLELIQSVQDWMALPEMSTPLNRRRLQQAVESGIAPVQLRALESLIFNDLAFSFYRVVEEAKIALSSQGAAVARLQEPGIDLWELYTRLQFEQDIRSYRDRVRQVVLETLQQSGLEPGQIQSVVTTGGSSSIPAFRALLAEIFTPAKIKSSDAFSSVVAGLGIKAASG
jgi:hypothetical chaperone protein